MLAIAITSAVAVAETKTPEYPVLDYKTATEAQYRDVFRLILENPTNSYTISKATKFNEIMRRKDFSDFINEVDSTLAERSFNGHPLAIYGINWSCGLFPKYGKKVLISSDLYDKFTYSYDCMTRKRIPTLYTSRLIYYGVDIDDLIRILGEQITFPSERVFVRKEWIIDLKKAIQQLASKSIKRKLREQGKSFVTKDGVNPCEEYLTRLNVALDAPRFAGLNAWLEELGFEARIDETKLLSEETITDLKQKIFYGEKNNTPFTEVVLLTYLGVEGYNQFVKEYNGDK